MCDQIQMADEVLQVFEVIFLALVAAYLHELSESGPSAHHEVYIDHAVFEGLYGRYIYEDPRFHGPGEYS